MLWRAKKAASARALVVSAATALAPFSQNSKVERSCGSGQAQPGQSNPCFWLSSSSAREPRISPAWLRTCRTVCFTAGQPPATLGGGPAWMPSASSGRRRSAIQTLAPAIDVEALIAHEAEQGHPPLGGER